MRQGRPQRGQQGSEGRPRCPLDTPGTPALRRGELATTVPGERTQAQAADVSEAAVDLKEAAPSEVGHRERAPLWGWWSQGGDS